jgi:hypothetical protein
MSRRVEALDRKLLELDTGHGAKGAAARLTVAIAGAEATVVEGVATAKTAIEVPTDEAGGVLTGKRPEKAKETAEKARGVKHEVATTIKVALGNYQAIFDKTRPGYEHFAAARGRYYEARKTCMATQGELSQAHNDAMKALEDAIEAMKQAEAEFEAAASGVDIDEQLKRLNEWSDTTSKGAGGDAMEIGADAMGGELMAGGEGAAETAEKDVAKTMTEEEVKEAEHRAEDAAKHGLRDKMVEHIKDMPKESVKEAAEDKVKHGVVNVAKTNAGGGQDKGTKE